MNFFKTIVAAGVIAASTTALSLPATAADITGAGATFPFPVYSKWADAYKKETGVFESDNVPIFCTNENVLFLDLTISNARSPWYW